VPLAITGGTAFLIMRLVHPAYLTWGSTAAERDRKILLDEEALRQCSIALWRSLSRQHRRMPGRGWYRWAIHPEKGFY
jgi:hypothetical protein